MLGRFTFSALLLLAMIGGALAEPKRVLILHSFGRDYAPWSEFARRFREELTKSSVRTDVYEASLSTARFPDNDDGPFADYLRTRFVKRQLDLVVTIGAPAANFVQQYRLQLFPAAPVFVTRLDQRRVPPNVITAKDTVVSATFDIAKVFENIMRVLPDTANIVVVLGNSPTEKYWLEQVRAAAQPFTKHVAFTWFNDLSLDEMLKRAATLRPRSASFFMLLALDAAGVSHEGEKALTGVHAVTSAPIFGYEDSNFGRGIVGGPLIAVSDVGRDAANVAIRILRGETPESIKTPPIVPGAPQFDWRELQRWNISESRLPPGSEIYFRTPSMWQQYRLQIAAGLAVLLLQTVMISWLLLERRRRHFAEAEASNRRRETIRLNRVATASVLSSSIAHELGQPLGAILNNTEAAQILLRAVPPNLTQIDEILTDIIRDEQRAGDIIAGLRNLLNNRNEADLHVLDLNETIRQVAGIVSPEAAKREIALITGQSLDTLPVRVDPIHLQQVVLNLVMNGMDAIEESGSRLRNLTIRTYRNADLRTAEVAVSDTGKGIPDKHLTTVFDAFFTTKPQGTGLGLPIARTIVESYGGAIWAENRDQGAMFFFKLPLFELPQPQA